MNCSCEYSKENLLKRISEIQFVCTELNLYMDTIPTTWRQGGLCCYASEPRLDWQVRGAILPLLGLGCRS